MALPLLGGAAPVSAQDQWSTGKQWLSARAGFANSNASGSGPGNVGFGAGYATILPSIKVWKASILGGWGLGGYVHYEVLGGFADAKEIEIPITAELVRHFNLNSAYRPYVGLGGGAYFRKTTGTGADINETQPGFYLNFGANASISGDQLLGLDFRVSRVKAVYDPPNPVFGAGSIGRSTAGVLEERMASHWSMKLNWALVR
jgi:hypothetical protein